MATAHDEDLVPVKLPSGGNFWVYGREVRYFNDRVKRYLKDNHFNNVSDLQTLDIILTMELLTWRYGVWLSQQTDYWQEPVDEKELTKALKDASAELRQLKQALGIDKVTRDKVKGEDSVHKYLENLKIRARAFGVMRERQLAKSIELFNDLKSRVEVYDNTTPDERREMRCDLEHILAWLRDTGIPEFDKVDAHFRDNEQRFWIRDQ
jgi:hypothetical protein